MQTKLARVVVDAIGNIVGLKVNNANGVQELVTSRFDPDTGKTTLVSGNNVISTDNSPIASPNGANSASTSYEHTQTVPSTTWSISHNLGRYTDPVIMDSAGSLVEGDVKNDNLNHVTLSFSSAFAGKAFCS